MGNECHYELQNVSAMLIDFTECMTCVMFTFHRWCLERSLWQGAIAVASTQCSSETAVPPTCTRGGVWGDTRMWGKHQM